MRRSASKYSSGLSDGLQALFCYFFLISTRFGSGVWKCWKRSESFENAEKCLFVQKASLQIGVLPVMLDAARHVRSAFKDFVGAVEHLN